MAILKDSVVSGSLRVTDSILANTIQAKVINAPASSGSATLGPGTNGQVLKSNGTTVYWAADNNSVTGVKGNSEGSYRTGQVNLTAANVGAVAVSQGTGNAGRYLKVNDSGNVEAVALTTKAAATYNTSTSDQTIAAGQYLTGAQTIKAVTTANISAANIKTGVTITVGDANSSTRIANVAGTYTAANTVSSGQTAAAAAQIRSGYSAWVAGAEVKGSMGDGTVVASVSSNTGGSASMAATGFTASSSATNYYVTLSTSAGSVKAKAVGGTAGYVTSSTTNETAATSVAVSGNGNKLYVPAGSFEATLDKTIAGPIVKGTLSGTGVNVCTTTKPSGTDGTDYVTFTPGSTRTSYGVVSITAGASTKNAGYIPANMNAGEQTYSGNIDASAYNNGTSYYLTKGTITNNTSGGTSSDTINRGSQIKIGAGYYASDVYYTAQANSGTKTINTSINAGGTSVDGYKNVTFSGINLPIPSGGSTTYTVRVPNGSSTIDFIFRVYPNGDVIIDEE